ncbi:MAG: cbb3-type cytochrome oxidase assembly protein CcoS [Gammaproteobacteria bacterium]
MEVVYLLVPLALLLVGVVIWALLWSIRSGQFDDLEGPAYRILMDDEAPRSDVPVVADSAAASRSKENIDTDQSSHAGFKKQ